MKLLFNGRRGLLVLIDPARSPPADAAGVARQAAASGAVGLLVGTSFDGVGQTDEVVRAIKRETPDLPVVLFPGSASQLSAAVDLVLLLSLVSGRNPQYLIEEHVRAVPFLHRHAVPTLSTAYLLIDGGRVTAVEAVTQTRPLPADKPELVAAHVAAAMLIGMAAVFLDTGSGADRVVSTEAIRAARRSAGEAPLFVGGGIRSPEQATAARRAGADYVVVGTAFERAGTGGIGAFAAAAGA